MFLVFGCTILGAAAQVLIKTGTASLGLHPSLVQTAIGLFTIPGLFFGYACYGVSTVLLILALRGGELSVLQPVIALTYVWVTILSVLVFHEPVNGWKIAGIAVIISGVTWLGKAGNS